MNSTPEDRARAEEAVSDAERKVEKARTKITDLRHE
jgi:hypothetical protein